MLTLDEAKNYLRVDFADDDKFITDLMNYSKEYLLGAGISASESFLYKLAQEIIINDRYNNRGSESVTSKAQSSLNEIILQLQNPDTEA